MISLREWCDYVISVQEWASVWLSGYLCLFESSDKNESSGTNVQPFNLNSTKTSALLHRLVCEKHDKRSDYKIVIIKAQAIKRIAEIFINRIDKKNKKKSYK